MKLSVIKITSNIAKTLLLPVVVYLLFLVLSIFTTGNDYGTWSSMSVILQQSVLNAIIGWSMSFNMLNGRWDFSVGSMVFIVAIIGASISANLGWGAYGILLFCIIFGIIFGIINGIVQINIGAPTLVTSFGLLMIYETLQAIVNDGRGAHVMGKGLTMFGLSPYVYYIAIIFGLIHFVIYTFTRFGYNTRALANNRLVATNIGINEKANILKCYLLCGLFVGVAAVVYVSFRGSVQLSMNMGTASLVFEAMIPVFIGMFIAKYSHITIGIYIGSLTVKMLTAGLLAVGLSSTLQTVVNGIVLFVIIAYSVNQAKIHSYFESKKRKKAEVIDVN